VVERPKLGTIANTRSGRAKRQAPEDRSDSPNVVRPGLRRKLGSACGLTVGLAFTLGFAATAASGPEPGTPASAPRANFFGDPFLQATAGIAACPVPAGPLITMDEMRAQAHGRVDRGTSCYRAGRCRLPNAYLYDKEIVPRVKLAIDADGRFADTSVWITGQRRWVWLEGCVRSQVDAEAIEELVRRIDDVEGVVGELQLLPR
jgi:hypothetical protein